MIEICSGHDTFSRDSRVRIAHVIKNLRPNLPFEPRNSDSYDLSWLLETLNDNEHASVFEALIALL
jgi:hypothetical protein